MRGGGAGRGREEGDGEGGGRGESIDCARGRVSRGRGGRAGGNFSGARAAGRAGSERRARREREPEGVAGASQPLEAAAPRPAPPAAAGFAAPGAGLRSINSRSRLCSARTGSPERRKVGLKVSAAAAAAAAALHSASGRGNDPLGPEGSLGLCRVQGAGAGGRTVGDSGIVGARPRARGYVLARRAYVFCIKFRRLAAPVAPPAPGTLGVSCACFLGGWVTLLSR